MFTVIPEKPPETSKPKKNKGKGINIIFVPVF